MYREMQKVITTNSFLWTDRLLKLYQDISDNRPGTFLSVLKSLFCWWELASVETGEDLSKDFVRGESWLLSGLSLLALRKLYIQIKCRFEGNKRWRYQVTQTYPEFYYV